MTDYQDALARYVVPESKDATAAYFRKFWLDASRMQRVWQPILTSVFGPASDRPAPEKAWSRTGFDVWHAVGGLTLTEAELGHIQECARITRDLTFAVIEDFDPRHPPHDAGPPLRFEFPIESSWSELMDGGYVSTELFGMPHKNYMIVGQSGAWGVYAANDWKNPTDLLIARKDCAPAVRRCFKDFG